MVLRVRFRVGNNPILTINLTLPIILDTYVFPTRNFNPVFTTTTISLILFLQNVGTLPQCAECPLCAWCVGRANSRTRGRASTLLAAHGWLSRSTGIACPACRRKGWKLGTLVTPMNEVDRACPFGALCSLHAWLCRFSCVFQMISKRSVFVIYATDCTSYHPSATSVPTIETYQLVYGE